MSEELYKSSLQKVIIETLEENIKPVIEQAVNGKVNGLRSELQAYIKKDEEWKAQDKIWKDGSEAWRLTAQPVVELNAEGKVVLRFIKWIGAIVVGFAGFLYAVQEIFKIKIF